MSGRPFGVRHWVMESNEDVVLPERFNTRNDAAYHAWTTAQECMDAYPEHELVRGRFADGVVRVSIAHTHVTICTHRVAVVGES